MVHTADAQEAGGDKRGRQTNGVPGLGSRDTYPIPHGVREAETSRGPTECGHLSQRQVHENHAAGDDVNS